MKKLLIQSDDYGFTYGVTDGTIRAIKDGVIGCTGLFVNMKSSAYAAERIKEVDVCLGIDINLCAGKPVSDPKLVSSLITPEGKFKSSRQILKENKLIETDKYIYIFETDPYNYEEVLIETENQVKRFIELVGKNPEYINGHSILTPNTEKAARVVAEKFGIKAFSSDLYYGEGYVDLAFGGDYVPSTIENQIKGDYTDLLLNKYLPSLREDKVSFFVGHCGYIDKDLFSETSLTVQRMNDVACATDQRIIDYIKNNDIQLVTYRDLYK